MALLDELSKILHIPEDELAQYLTNASRKYKVFRIPKRNGAGWRTIAQPAKPLKDIQRAFLSLFSFPSSASAFAYRKHISIKENAAKHAKNAYLLKLDLTDFFHSLKPARFWTELGARLPGFYSALYKEKALVEEILFWRPKSTRKLLLSIGAPSSPAVSNFCLAGLDEVIEGYCRKESITYTRYADDLTFSTNRRDTLVPLLKWLRQTALPLYPELSINAGKTVFASKGTNRHVTGVTITNEGKLSVGRHQKRVIRALVHRYQVNTITPEDLAYLKGYLSFCLHIEPAFLEQLKAKYGPAFIDELRYPHAN